MEEPGLFKMVLCAAMTGALLGCGALPTDAPSEEVTAEAAAALERDPANAPKVLQTPNSEPQAPEDVYIEDIATGGPGCPDPSTVSVLIAANRKSFLVIFDEMVLEYPPKPLIKYTNCVAGVTLHIPNGVQFTLATVNTRGYAYLTQGLKAKQTSKYFFAGQPIGASFHTTLNGFFDGPYDFTDYVGISSVVWSPCGGSAIFAIDTSLNLNAVASQSGTGFFNTETLDGAFAKEFHWMWQECDP